MVDSILAYLVVIVKVNGGVFGIYIYRARNVYILIHAIVMQCFYIKLLQDIKQNIFILLGVAGSVAGSDENTVAEHSTLGTVQA